MLDWLEFLGLEYRRLFERVGHKVLSCEEPDLGIRVGKEAHELWKALLVKPGFALSV
jgi:hypothetical protein